MEQTSMLADQQRELVPDPMHMPSRRHVSLVIGAIEDRASVIENLAKKNKDEGYHKMSRELLGDVHMLREEVLPAIREQQELPLAGPDESRSAVANYLRHAVHMSLTAKETEELLLDRLGKRLQPLLEKMYEVGFLMGVTRREDDPDLMIVKACARVANDEAARG